MRMRAKALGNASGYVLERKGRASITPRTSVELEDVPLELAADSGKFGDSEDSFVYLYTKIDPSCHNFELRACICAYAQADAADQQTGYGILLADTDSSKDTWCRHRNHMLVGCFGAEHRFGVRVATGYTDSGAREFRPVRIYDPRRMFSISAEESLGGKPHLFCVKKSDAGIEASIDGETTFISGCDFLMKQDGKHLCVGFAVARKVAIHISDVSFTTSPGSMSHTPEGEFMYVEPATPFSASVLDVSGACARVEDATIYVSPDAQVDGKGTPDEPLTIEEALRIAGPGSTVMLEPGTYELTAPLIVGRGQSGEYQRPICIKAQYPRQSVIDGAKLVTGLPLLVLGADCWHISGVVFANGPANGLLVVGSANRIENCEAHGNGDTGILICAPAGVPRASWPANNYVVDCDSHGNRDAFNANADGFGAKLRVGCGNVFYRCIAHHNADDGFDLYAKSVIGPIDAVKLDGCIAYANESMGFKLGGENQPVEHEAWNCLAIGNAGTGFSSNSNPSCSVHFCTALGNGPQGMKNIRLFSADAVQHVCQGTVESRKVPVGDIDAAITRKPDGSIGVRGFRTVRWRGSSRAGADFK